MSRFSSRFSSLCALCLVGAFLSGCAAVSAFGFGVPNREAIKAGASRAQVEAQFGKPIARELVQDGTTIDIYQYTAHRNPSVMRGIGHIIGSVLTLGVWELAMEDFKSNRIETHRVRVVYDKDGKLIKSRTIESYSNYRYSN